MRCRHLGLEGVVLQLLGKVVLAGATAFDLHKVRRRKHRAHQGQVQQIRAVVTGGHHAHGDADACFAGFVDGYDVARSHQVVAFVREIDGELLRIGDQRGDLHRKVRLV